jgi:hypothetical protein
MNTTKKEQHTEYVQKDVDIDSRDN